LSAQRVDLALCHFGHRYVLFGVRHDNRLDSPAAARNATMTAMPKRTGSVTGVLLPEIEGPEVLSLRARRRHPAFDQAQVPPFPAEASLDLALRKARGAAQGEPRVGSRLLLCSVHVGTVAPA